jgi:triacylglycerol lipase
MATLGRILSWWGQDYAYAAYWQVRATLRPGRRERYESGTGRPVVVIPGVWEPWGFLGPVIEALHGAGHPVRVIPALGRNGRPVPDAARTVAGFLEENDLRDVVIVAHSKGGLIGKYVMSEHDPDDRITAMVAICTPFAGSDYARYMAMRTLRAFSPSDPTTVMLQANLETNARITNITIQDGGHFRLLDRPEVIDIVVEVAGRSAAAQEEIVDETMAAGAHAPASSAASSAEEAVDTPLPPDAEVTRGGTPETPTVP